MNCIPLVNSKVEKLIGTKEKNVFQIETSDHIYVLKAKSEEDMQGW